MTLRDSVILALAGAVGGALNALAGGGSFLTLPALMFTGVPAVLANTTSSVAMWSASLLSLFAYRRDLAGRKHPLGLYAAMALIGGSLGAFLLLRSTNAFFLKLLPWLLLLATLLFVYGSKITAWVAARSALARARRAGSPAEAGPDAEFPKGMAYVLLFGIAVYGGYFGGGMGIMTLAVLAVIGMRDIHEMNAVKVLWVLMINGVAVAIFIARGEIDWAPCAVMTAGSVTGGYLAGRMAHRFPQIAVRRFIIAVAVIMTAYYFWRLISR